MEKNKKQQGFEFIIKKSDVLERENFGSFEIVITKGYACFKNYTGFRVFTTPYAVVYTLVPVEPSERVYVCVRVECIPHVE